MVRVPDRLERMWRMLKTGKTVWDEQLCMIGLSTNPKSRIYGTKNI
jgi:hypothetical protein